MEVSHACYSSSLLKTVEEKKGVWVLTCTTRKRLEPPNVSVLSLGTCVCHPPSPSVPVIVICVGGCC